MKFYVLKADLDCHEEMEDDKGDSTIIIRNKPQLFSMLRRNDDYDSPDFYYELDTEKAPSYEICLKTTECAKPLVAKKKTNKR